MQVGDIIVEEDGSRARVTNVLQDSPFTVFVTERVTVPLLCRLGLHPWGKRFNFKFILDSDIDFGIIWEQTCPKCGLTRSLLSQGTD